jgi:hypothetical protein
MLMLILLCFCSGTVLLVPSAAENVLSLKSQQSEFLRPDFNHAESLWTMDYIDVTDAKQTGEFIIYPCRESSYYFACLKSEVRSWMQYFTGIGKDRVRFSETSIGNVVVTREDTARTVYGVFAASAVRQSGQDCDDSCEKLKSHPFYIKMGEMDCRADVVAKLVALCQWGVNQDLADSLGVSISDLSKLKQPIKYKLHDKSPLVVKTWQWFMETDPAEIKKIMRTEEADLE